MFNFGTIGAYKQVRNNPRTKAVIDLKNGYVVIPNDATGLAPTAATPTEAKGNDLHFVFNIIDKPEIRNSKDFYVAIGEYVRAFKIKDLEDLLVELSEDTVNDSYDSVNVGDTLVACDETTDTTAKGKWKVSTGTDYSISLKILEKTTFGGKGFYAKVMVQQ